MARTSSKTLNDVAARLAKMTGIDFEVNWAYGRPRLMSDKGSRDVSPRLPSGQLLDWMYAYAKGYDDASRGSPATRGNPRRRRTIAQRTRDRDNTLRLSVPELHQLRIARDTLQMSDAGARIMGGPTKDEAREIIRRLTGREPRENPRPRRTARRRGLMKDVQFFRRHAGGIVGEATKGALSLARAEREMLRRDWVVLWEPDEDADLSWMDDEQQKQDHDVYCAVLVAPTKRTGSSTSDILASLCGIVDPSQEYKRVVEAELAAEALARDI